nr:hypothetical protein [Tanacetum cinerariifolium]
EVIINEDSLVPTVVIDDVIKPATLLSADQKLAKRNELKARGTLLMALPDKQQLKFNSHKDANLPSEWKTHTLIWINKANLEEHSLDDLFNSLRIYEAEVKHSSSPGNPTQNIAFMSSSNTDNTTDSVSAANSVSVVCAQLPVSPKDTRRTGAAEPQRRHVPVETSTSNALVSQCDGIESYDWSYQAEEEPVNFALMAITSSSSSFDNESGKPAQDKSHATRPMAPIIEDWVSDSEDESKPNDPQSAPSFVQTFEHVKPSGHFGQPIEAPILDATPKPTSSKTNGSSKRKNRKTCFVCRSVDHLIKDCNFHKTSPKPRNYAHRGYNKQYASFTKNHPQKHIVPAVVLTKSKLVSITAVRPVSSAVPNNMVSRPRHAYSLTTRSKSPFRRHLTHSQSPKTSNSHPKVIVAKAPVVSAAKGKKRKWGNPQYALKDKGVIDSGCSWHMTGNMSYLFDFQELNVGYVAFRGNPKGGKISSKGKIKTDFKLPDESQVLLRVPRENNMYNVNLKDIVPSRYLTCLFAKAKINESNLWHRRLGHINFKTINNLVKGNLVRGLPTKVFENNNTCVACKKGKQHRATCKTKPVSSINKPLFRLHMDLFGPTFVKSLNKKCYCLVITDDYSRFTWVFFLATKDETSPILKTFITGLENQLSLKVKVIRSDNGIKFKNFNLNQFYSLLPIPFWAEAVNTACYVQNRVLVNKPQNKTPYELLHGRTPSTGPTWLFDIDSLTRTMNYQPIIAGNQSNPSVGFQEEIDAEKAGEEATQQYPLFPVWSTGSSKPQNKEGDAAFDGKEHDAEKPESAVNLFPSSKREDITYFYHENVGGEADFNNLETSITVSPVPTTRTNKDHPVAQIIDYASFMGFMVYQMDVKSAFLYGTIEEEVYVCQPLGFEDPNHPDKVYKVVKVLYGLHQAPRAWYETLANYLLENDFHRGQIDQTLFIKKKKGDILLVKQKEDGIFINKDKYVAEILKKFRSMIGSLMYLTSSRPDIMFVVCACVRFQVTPKASHLHVVKRIFRYLKGKPHLGLWYPKDLPFDLVAYSDSDYASGSLDRKSITGGCQFLGCRLISWQCKKQTVIATSSTEAEYVASASCCAQVLWIQNQMLDYSAVRSSILEKKVVVTEAAIRDVLHLDDAEGIDCLPNEEIFTALAHMGYEKSSTKLTFYIAFFSSQWKFLIHTILQSMSAKRTSWNEFSSALALAVICLSIGHKFNFSKYIFESLQRNVDSSSKFYMYPRVGKGCSRVETPLFEGMLVAREPEEQGNAEEQGNDDNAAEEPVTAVDDEALDTCVALARQVEHLEHDKVAQDLKIIKLKTRVKKLEKTNKGRMIDELDKDEGAELMNEKDETKEVKDITGDAQVEGRQAEIYQINMDHVAKVLNMQEDEPEVHEVVEVVKTAKLIIEVVAVVSETVSVVDVVQAVVPAATVTPAPVKSKDKEKGIMVEEPKPIKKKQQVEMDEAYARKLHKELNQDIDWEVAIDHVKQKAKENPYVQRYQKKKKRPQTEAQARRNMMVYLKNTAGFRLDYFKGMSYDDIRPIFDAKFNANMDFLLKSKEQMEEEESRPIVIINETPAQKAAKRRRLNKEAEDVEELKQYLEIVPDEDDDVYTEATPLARKVPVVDYPIMHVNNKPRYKIIKVDGTHQMYGTFVTMLKNFDRDDLETLWSIVKESFGVDAAIELKEKHQVFTAAVKTLVLPGKS